VWFDRLGEHLVDRGNPVFARQTAGTVQADGPLGGYTLITADDLRSPHGRRAVPFSSSAAASRSAS
jgi:hypothetical protein